MPRRSQDTGSFFANPAQTRPNCLSKSYFGGNERGSVGLHDSSFFFRVSMLVSGRASKQ